MDEEEAALLAELRAISSARSDSRFGAAATNNDDDEEEGGNTADAAAAPQVGDIGASADVDAPVISADDTGATSAAVSPSSPAAGSSSDSADDDAFVDAVESHQGDAVPADAVDKASAADVGTSITANDSTSANASANDNGNAAADGATGTATSSTFTGERGGDAHDEELLALLRGVSSKSTQSRFGGNGDDVDENDDNDNSGDDKNEDDNAEGGNGNDDDEDAFLPNAATNTNNNAGTGTGGASGASGNKDAVDDKGKDKDVRSGDAHDEELLAELRAVSNKQSGRGGDTSSDKQEDTTPSSVPAVAASAAGASADANEGGKDNEEEGGLKTAQTFAGERGGAAEDAELLALLRGVSSKSSSNDRFGGGGDDEDDGGADAGSSGGDTTVPSSTARSSTAVGDKTNKAASTSSRAHQAAGASVEKADADAESSVPPWRRGKKVSKSAGGAKSRSKTGELPPWKRKAGATAATTTKGDCGDAFDVEISVAGSSPPPADAVSNSESAKDTPISSSGEAPAPTSEAASSPKPTTTDGDQDEGGFKNTQTFTGERGGAAEDAELLALLRGVSTSNNRFSGGDEQDFSPVSADVTNADINTDAVSNKEPTALPPWKRGKKAPPKRGSSKQTTKSTDVPPWKRKSDSAATTNSDSNASSEVDIVVSGPPIFSSAKKVVDQSNQLESSESANVCDEDIGGFKTSSTFTGERGGAAQDEELLALLRGVSSKSNSNGRFPGEADAEELLESDVATGTDKAASSLPPWEREKSMPSKKESSSNPNATEAELPPWKRKKATGGKKVEDTSDSAVAISSDVSLSVAERKSTNKSVNDEDVGGFKTSSTFSGERGGAAEDAELLALLRGVSSKSSGGNRFGEDDDVDSKGHEDTSSAIDFETKTKVSPPVTAAPPVSMEASQPPSVSAAPSPPEASRADVDADAPLVTRETLQESLASKDWKVRKASYELLSSILHDMAGASEGSSKDPSNDVDANTIMPSLDEAISAMVKDSNAAALDAALKFATLYADYCRGATSSSRASAIVTSLYKGSGLSASRPTTTKLSQALPLKLMEVGEGGPSSVHSVVEVLLQQGLASRKPKVVLNSANLVLDAAKSFGAGALPVASVASSAPKILGHSNAKVREAGMNIIAEICRALGSKKPLQSVMDTLKPAQMLQLDGLLEKQPEPTPPQVGLRYGDTRGDQADSPDDVLAALEAGAKEAAAKKLASRKAVNIFELLPKTEYASKLKEAKWSEKTGALDILIQCGGEQPYKLVQPSSTVTYTDLIRDLRKLLEHTHFAVNSKAMAAISMLAEGVGEKLFPNLRPMLLQLTGLSKDKKLTAAVGKCLDSIFGNVLSFDHLLDKSDALPTALDERKQKNALARKSTLEFLGRCIERGESAGPRGTLTPDAAENAAKLACLKLKDSDAQPRKAAMDILQALRRVEDDDIAPLVNDAIAELKIDNPRAYKTLTASMSGGSAARGASRSQSAEKVGGSVITASTKSIGGASSRSLRSMAKSSSVKSTSRGGAAAKAPQKESSRAMVATSVASESIGADEDAGANVPSTDEAIMSLAEFGIPNWDSDEDDGGVLAGLKSSDWKKRKAAIEALTAYVKSDGFRKEQQSVPSPFILIAVKAHTKGFKEVNFNVVKAIMELFLALSECHADNKQPPDNWICRDAVALSVEKIADRKYSTVAPPLLTSLCVVRAPKTISGLTIALIGKVKSPIPHEALLKWHQDICIDFGAAAFGNGINAMVPWILKEAESSNIKVRKMAMRLVGELHSQLGPVFKALILSGDLSAAVKTLVESGIDASPYDPSSSTIEREKRSICCSGGGGGSGSGSATDEGGNAASALGGIEIPKMDLIAALPDNCVESMGSKEGKTAWKLRKQALEDVGAALERCSGLICTSPQNVYAALVELVRAMRGRLSDSQSNLKPVAAKQIGVFLSCCDKTAQAKLGKLVFGPLINAAMTDNKKIMRDAAITALQSGTELHAMEGGECNSLALDSMIGCLVTELKDSDFKAGGLPEVISFVAKRSEHLPKAISLQSSKAQAQEAAFAASIVACLTSSKSETRAEAEALLRACSDHEVLTAASIQAGSKKLLPAQQRAVAGIIDGLGTGANTDALLEKENLTSSAKSPTRRSAVSRTASARAPGTGSIRSRPASSLTRSRPGSRSSARSQSSIGDGLRSSSSSNAAGTNSLAKGSFSGHPLLSDSPGSSTRDMRSSALARKRENWPEYPEEPSGSSTLTSVKKIWAQLLPTASIDALFPKSGIQKQDDAEAGCQLISRAVQLAVDDDDAVVFDQLDIICKWIACAMCSRENTVGLQTLLTLLSDLFECMKSKDVQLSDPEAAVLLPILLEKASASKGRFRKMFQDLISQINDGGLYPPQRYGPHICMVIVERTHHAKTRGLAMKECQACIELCGLDGIGKKGIQVTAKTFSEEKLTENRTIALDLLVGVIERLNGDLQKFARLCGNSNLSHKAKELIEERWAKHEQQPAAGGKGGNVTSRPRKTATSSLRSSARSSGIPGLSPGSAKRDRARAGTSALSLRKEGDNDDEVNAFPTLKLNLDDAAYSSSAERSANPLSNVTAGEEMISPTPREELFTFQYSGRRSSNEALQVEPTVEAKRTTSATEKMVTSSASIAASGKQSSAGVSSLRERLAKLRSRKGGGAEGGEGSSVIHDAGSGGNDDVGTTNNDEEDHEAAKSLPTINVRSALDAKAQQDSTVMSRIDKLMLQPIPLAEDDPAIKSVEESLRTIHAAVSGKGGDNADAIKNDLVGQTPQFLTQMSRALRFACKCGDKNQSGGMSTALISLLLATLMQTLKDGELAKRINDTCLATLVEESANLLLDPRITTVGIDSVNGIDQTQREQIQRATNKVAIMAIISAPTHESVIALMRLQVKVCRLIPTGDDGTDKNARLAKIMTKLMARTIKSESSKATPFDGFDLEAFVCAVSDLVKATRDDVANPQAASSCHAMAKTIITAVIKANGSAVPIRDTLLDCELTKEDDPLVWDLVESCEEELGLTPALISPMSEESRSADGSSSADDDIKRFGEVIAEGAGATDAISKQRFKSRLLAFVSNHPNLDVDAQLIPLSEHFRAFILECLGRAGDDILRSSNDRGIEEARTVKDRLDQIKANLQTTEDFVAASTSSAPAVLLPSNASGIASSGSTSGIAAGAPSTSSSSAASTLRARLAASRTAVSSSASSALAPSEMNSSQSIGAGASSASTVESGGGGGAAALRARLNRLKNKKESQG